MRKICAVLCFAAVSLSLSAQAVCQLTFDYEDGIYGLLEFDEFAANIRMFVDMSDFAEFHFDDNADEEILAKYLRFNEHRFSAKLPEGFVFASSPDVAKPYVVVKILKVAKNGSVTARVSLFLDGEEAFVWENVRGHGGHFGSFMNLFGDGMEKLGGKSCFRSVLSKTKKWQKDLQKSQ